MIEPNLSRPLTTATSRPRAVPAHHPASLTPAAFAAKLDDARAADWIAEAGPRLIPIRSVPRAAVEALVVRLAAQGFRHIVTSEASPYAG